MSPWQMVKYCYCLTVKSADRFLRKKDEMDEVNDGTLFLTRKALLVSSIAQLDGRPELMILVYC